MAAQNFAFKHAVREEVGLLIGLVGPSSSGKTYSAMRLAKGIVGEGNRFAFIDTESRRALHYADKFDFDHCELNPPFRPENYTEAVKAALKEGYKAIVIDSMSHEWNSEGGILDWQEEELTRMVENAKKKGTNSSEYQLRESMKMASWIKPKSAHKMMVQKFLQVNTHIIFCFRAEEKIKMEKDKDNKTKIVPIGWQPICSKEMPYELTTSFLLSPDNPGFPIPLKLQDQHKHLFPEGKHINEEAGRSLAEWAKGGASDKLSNQQLRDIKAKCDAKKLDIQELLKHFNVKSGGELKESQLSEITDWIAAKGKE